MVRDYQDSRRGDTPPRATTALAAWSTRLYMSMASNDAPRRAGRLGVRTRGLTDFSQRGKLGNLDRQRLTRAPRRAPRISPPKSSVSKSRSWHAGSCGRLQLISVHFFWQDSKAMHPSLYKQEKLHDAFSKLIKWVIFLAAMTVRSGPCLETNKHSLSFLLSPAHRTSTGQEEKPQQKSGLLQLLAKKADGGSPRRYAVEGGFSASARALPPARYVCPQPAAPRSTLRRNSFPSSAPKPAQPQAQQAQVKASPPQAPLTEEQRRRIEANRAEALRWEKRAAPATGGLWNRLHGKRTTENFRSPLN